MLQEMFALVPVCVEMCARKQVCGRIPTVTCPRAPVQLEGLPVGICHPELLCPRESLLEMICVVPGVGSHPRAFCVPQCEQPRASPVPCTCIPLLSPPLVNAGGSSRCL